MQNARLDEAQAGIKTAGRNINNLSFADDTTLVAESEEELKSLLMKVKEESEKVGLKLSIQKTKIMASSSITSWQIDGKQWKQWETLSFWAPKISADCDCSHEIKSRLFLGRKAMTNLDSILKRRDIILPTKVCLVKAKGFPVVMYGCESWTVKKAECRRIDVFELWCWRRLLRVPWTARTSNQSLLKEISPGCSFEGLMLKLKLQYFGYLMWRTESLEKTLMRGTSDGGRRRGWQRMRRLMASLTRWTWIWARSLSKMVRRSNQSILREINPEYLEELMLKLKLQYSGHLMQRANSLEKTLIENRRRRGHQWMRWLDGITDTMDMSLSMLQDMVKQAWHVAVHGSQKLNMTEWLNNNIYGYYAVQLFHSLFQVIHLLVQICIILMLCVS